MMSRFSRALRVQINPRFCLIIPVVMGVCVLLLSSPALAHHPLGDRIPSTFFEGFMSGLAHPMIGLDHLAFIVGVGLLAAVKPRGILIPLAFVGMGMLGTMLHLANLTLPGVEILVAFSILLLGLLLAVENNLNLAIVVGLGAIAGVCHGYAYGESIVGAELSPLVAYLTGFTLIQALISLCAFAAGRYWCQHSKRQALNLRSAGWVMCGVGLTFFSSQLMSLVLATPR